MFSRGKLARFVTGLPLVLSRHLWIWPLIGAILISLVGLWTRALVEGSVKAELISRMQTLLSANVAALKLWISEQESDVKALVADPRIQEAVTQLTALALDPNSTSQALIASAPNRNLQAYLRPVLDTQHYLDYVVVGPDRRILASALEPEIGRIAQAGYEPFIRRALSGQALISRPFIRQADGVGPARTPTMFVAAPVLSPYGDVLAVLALRMDPQGDFSRIFSVARIGETGEAFAFDSRGVMLTNSRFTEDLKAAALLPNSPDATAILNVQLVDPGASIGPGRPFKLNPHMPLTRMAASATTQWDGYDAEGYRTYRGVRVIGAWAWLPEYGIGVATELATEEAFQTLNVLRRVFLSLFLLLALSGAAIFAFSLIVERLERSVRRTAIANRRLGSYLLIEEISRGANGIVYRGRHVALRRPVAVKILSPDGTNQKTIARFEHEVQMTSQLTHPNTVAIYDYGRTPEGLFYYAMEFLSGIDLHGLVRQFGPQPPGRVIHILRQVCGSLAEAHRIGLIHRDVKPANIFLTRRGGVSDTVKVLDFGLVKAVNLSPKGLAADAIVGTPHFMSPEAISSPETVDRRTDIFSVGAVAYWLLTARTLFQADTIKKLLDRHASEEPAPISSLRQDTANSDLHRLIMACLARDPAKRPASAELLAEELSKCAAAATWTAADAKQWWSQHLGASELQTAATLQEKTLVLSRKP